MNVSIKETGVIKASGIIDDNMLLDTLKDSGKSHTSYNIADFNFSESVVSGEKYTIIAKVNTSEEKKSIAFYHSGGSYSMSGWMAVPGNGIYIKTFTASSNMASQTNGAGHGYCRIYTSTKTTGGNTDQAGTANVEWIKIVKGESATSWSPNPADTYFNSNQQGFIEANDIARIFDGHIEATQFYEI